MGENTLTFITGFVEYEIEERCDCDFIAGSIFTTLANEEYEQFSQEIRLTSPAGNNMECRGGAFYQTGDLDYADNIIIPSDTVLQVLAGGALASITNTSVHRDYFADSDLWAAFGQSTWNVSDTLRLTLGGRYTSEDKDASRVINIWIINIKANIHSFLALKALLDIANCDPVYGRFSKDPGGK